jgi:cytochrome subunit of sulfide dehydrogenase
MCAGMDPAPAAEDLPAPPPGAASCTGCHPMRPNVDTPLSPLAGFYGSNIALAMKVFRAGTRPATVMDRIARGFSDDEIEAIQAWFMRQPAILDKDLDTDLDKDLQPRRP